MSETGAVLIAGAGPLLGAAVAREFADAGWPVGLVARSEDRIESLADTIRESGGEALAVPADVTEPDAVESAVETVRETLGRIEVVVHNASVRSGGPIDHADPASFERVWRVRAFGGFCLVRAALADLRETNGTVVFSGTTYAEDPPGEMVDWASGAAATRGLAGSLADGLDGVQVTYVAIGAGVARDDEHAGSSAVYASDVAETYRDLAANDSAVAERLTLRPRE